MSAPAKDRATPLEELERRCPGVTLTPQATQDGIPTVWILTEDIHAVLRSLKEEMDRPYRMLYDLTAIDERVRRTRPDQPGSDFTLVYHLLSFERNQDIRLKVALTGAFPSLRTITDIWPCANWYEREVWDMFGISFEGHPHLRRILMPDTWQGHPLRKEHPARATEMGPSGSPTTSRRPSNGPSSSTRRSGGSRGRARAPTSCS